MNRNFEPGKQIVMRDLGGFLQDSEIDRMYDATEYQRDKLLILLLAVTGRRISEILMLKVKDIMYEDKNINWHIEKKGRKKLGTNLDYRRIKPIDENTLNELVKYIEQEDLKKAILDDTAQELDSFLKEKQ